MHKIYFYRDKNGSEPVAEYIAALAQKKDKDSWIKLNKIRDYIKTLSEYGTQAGAPYLSTLMAGSGNCGHSVTGFSLSAG